MAVSTTEQDFFQIKENLKDYLRGQTDFADFDFEGSAMSNLLDVLAYNTHYSAITANMSVNEMFLDTAQLRSNIISHARSLGYTSTSMRSAMIEVDIAAEIPESTAKVTISRGSKLNTNSGLTFTLLEDRDAIPKTISGNTTVSFKNVKFYEGKLLKNSFTVSNTDSADHKFVIPNSNCDTTTLSVGVLGGETIELYAFSKSIIDLKSDSKVYFLEEVDSEKYQISFGDNILGKKLEEGDVVQIEYLKTQGQSGNNISTFSGSAFNAVQGTNTVSLSSIITTPAEGVSKSAGGSNIESISSIKINAPFSYAAQNRAVTVSDYHAIITQLLPDSDTVSVWGGEDNEPPAYGKVFISIKPESGELLSTPEKLNFLSQINQYKVAGLIVEMVDAEYMYIDLFVDCRYNSKITTLSSSEIKTKINEVIEEYDTSTLTEFNTIHRNSNLSSIIDSADPSIMSSTINHRTSIYTDAFLNDHHNYVISFNNPLSSYHIHSGNTSRGGIYSNNFYIHGSSEIHYIKDDGIGNVVLYGIINTVETIINPIFGTVNYSSGKVDITSLNITGFTLSDTKLQITGVLDSLDIVPFRNQILKINNSTISITEDSIESRGSIDLNYTTVPSRR